MDDATKLLLIAGGAAALWLYLDNEWEKLTEEERAALAYSAQFPFGAGGWKQRALSFYARLRGTFQPGILPEPGVNVDPDRPAVAGPHLGPPKNVLGIAGIIRTIENQDPRAHTPEQGIIAIPFFADTILVDAALENQSRQPYTGVVKARLLVGHANTPYFVESKVVDLPPGAFRQVTLRVPRDYVYNASLDIALQWDKHTLDTLKVGIISSL